MKLWIKLIRDSRIAWKGVFLLTSFTAFFYVFMEWLFTVTKPSFMTNLNFIDKFEILLFVGALGVFLGVLPLGLLFLTGRIHFFRKFEKYLFSLAAIIPASLLSALILILFDNFTYTLFRFGIVSTERLLRGFYGIGFLTVLLWVYQQVRKMVVYLEERIQKQKNTGIFVLFMVIFMVGAISVPFFRHGSLPRLIPESTLNSSSDQLPNIILITSDGLNADHMSIYGYDRDTTPFLMENSDQFLIAENAFSNSANTTGSIISILTGKNPTTTRVLYPPDILTSIDSYQHLPGILKSAGYFTVELGFEVYVDAYNQNLLNGFDLVNGRKLMGNKYFDQLNSYFPGQSAYFCYETFNRIFDRLRHIFFVNKMENAFEQVTIVAESFADSQKLEQLYGLLEQKDQPIFAHIHWMGTHGAKFFPEQQVFSLNKQKDYQMEWDLDFYDDSILELDQTIREIYEKLSQIENDVNTIIVLASDHGQHYVTNERLPLIFLFPDGDFSKRFSLNSQNLDIAPTLLDYLGLEIPGWMQGNSLLIDLEKQKPVFSTGVGRTTVEGGFTKVDATLSKPPFYQFGKISLIDCNQFYELQLDGGLNMVSGTIENYKTQCEYLVSSDREAVGLMIDHLAQNKFDTGVLEEWAKSHPNP